MSGRSLKTVTLSFGKALLYVLALVGLLDILGRVLLVPFSGSIYGHVVSLPLDYTIRKVVPSKDGLLKAVVYLWAGPAFDAGCEEMVAVVGGSQSVNTAWRAENIVYRAECNELGQIGWEPPAEGRVTPRLRIDADPARAISMSRLAVDGAVAVAFRDDR